MFHVHKIALKKILRKGTIAHPDPEDQIWDNCGDCAMYRDDRRDRYVDYYKCPFWCSRCRFRKFRHWHGGKHYPTNKNKQYLKDYAKFRAHLMRVYAITILAYDHLFVQQEGKCAICKKKPGSGNKKFTRLLVDHCHESGEVRGLLCPGCNAGLGLLGDTEAMLQNACAYFKVALTHQNRMQRSPPGNPHMLPPELRPKDLPYEPMKRPATFPSCYAPPPSHQHIKLVSELVSYKPPKEN